MSQSDEQTKSEDALQWKLLLFAGQVGCLTAVIIVVALLAGFWIDNNFNTKPWFTLILLIGSVPVTLVVMLRVAKAATAHMKIVPPKNTETSQEDVEIGNHS